jgi:hypothetical protein
MDIVFIKKSLDFKMFHTKRVNGGYGAWGTADMK